MHADPYIADIPTLIASPCLHQTVSATGTRGSMPPLLDPAQPFANIISASHETEMVKTSLVLAEAIQRVMHSAAAQKVDLYARLLRLDIFTSTACKMHRFPDHQVHCASISMVMTPRTRLLLSQPMACYTT